MNEMVRAIEFALSTKMVKSDAQAQEFYLVALDPEGVPCFVADEATVWSVYFGEDEAALTRRCQQHYGVILSRDQFDLPLWQVLDFLEAHRTKYGVMEPVDPAQLASPTKSEPISTLSPVQP